MTTKYLTATILLLLSEFILIKLPENQATFWVAIARLLAAIVLVVWYCQSRKPLPTLIDKLFITGLILPIFISLCVIFFPKAIKDFNLITHAIMLGLWAAIFKIMGASIKGQGSFYKFLRIIPIYSLVPILFYIFSLHPALPDFEKIMLLTYTAIYIYTSTLASFLPVSDSDKFWISWSVVLMSFANLLVFYSIFVEPLPWLGFIPRAIVILSRCILIIGMVDYFKSKEIALSNQI